jgi:glycosyltransferase involved in cell wall biosynthesis
MAAERRTGRLSVRLDATPLIGNRTGVGVFCEGVLSALAARDDVEVAAFAVTWRRRHWLHDLLPPGVRAQQRSMPARPLHHAWARSDRPPIEWFIGKADVVHGTNFVVPPTRGALRVVTVHDLTTVRFPELCDTPTLRFPALVARAVADGAWVHTPSQFVADECIEQFGVDPSRVRAVHSGIPVLPPADLSAPLPIELPPGCDRYLLAIGTAEPRKDFPGLVRAFDRLAGTHRGVALVIVGQDGWGAAALGQAIAEARFSGRIARVGWLDDAGVARLYAGAIALVFPSVYEGFGFPPLQAMAAGVPVVATATGAVPEIVGDAAELATPGDPDALRDAIVRILDDEARRADLVVRGTLRATQFDWSRTAAGLVELYRDALSQEHFVR